MLQVAVRELARPLDGDAYESLRGVDVRPLEAALVLEGSQSLSNLCGFCTVERRLHCIMRLWLVQDSSGLTIIGVEQRVHVRLAGRLAPLVDLMVREELVAARARSAHPGPLRRPSVGHFEKAL